MKGHAVGYRNPNHMHSDSGALDHVTIAEPSSMCKSGEGWLRVLVTDNIENKGQ